MIRFLLGMFVGTAIGILVMCLMQAAGQDDHDERFP